MDSNGHLASVGSASDKASYEHGVQVIDENKEFKYVFFFLYAIVCLLIGRLCSQGHYPPPPITCLA